MDRYLLIASRDPFECADVPYFFDLGQKLLQAGHQVTLYLVQNAVLTVRPSRYSNLLTELCSAGVKVMADDFSIRERGITHLAQGIHLAPLDLVVDEMASGSKVIWH